jgi:hypothetical protein
VEWEDGFKETSRSRNTWRRLKFVQPAPFQRSVALRYRTYEKSIQVKCD